MKKISLLIFLLLPFLLPAQQIANGLVASNGTYIGFYEYKPTDYNPGGAYEYPLIIFLHGIGERGNGTSELSRILGLGIPNNIQQGHPMRFFWNGKWETFLVLSPQLSSNYGWWPDFYVEEMLDYAKKNLKIDKDRIFLTGLSLGGGGTWQYAGSSHGNAKKFAGIAPVCGTCQNIDACNIAKADLPVWAFHAADDGVVSAGCTTGMISNIYGCNPAVKPYMTIWPDGNHWIWGRAYTTDYSYQSPNMYEWFLGQDKKLPVNVRPLSRAGGDITTTTAVGSATLNGTASYDADGNIVRYAWRKISGPSFGNISSPTSATTSVTGLALEGTYQYELQVIDNRADWSLDTVTVHVGGGIPIPQNQPPTVSAGSNSTITLPTSSTTLSGSATDPDGYIIGYLWTKVSGPTSYSIESPNSPSTVISNLVAGVYIFNLKASDNSGAIAEANVSVTVNQPVVQNQPPTVSAGANTMITLPTNSSTLSGTANDPDGYIAGYLWTKVSGPSSCSIANPGSASTAISDLQAGTYVFNLKVMDNSYALAEANVSVTVNPAAQQNQSPSVSAGTNTTITLPTNHGALMGSAYDPDGYIAGYLWTKVSGPSSYTIENPDSESTEISHLVAGTYVFNLKVMDNSYALAEANVMVNVVENSGTIIPPPIRSANAGPDVSINLPTNNAILNGSGSQDPNGAIHLYQWSKLSGPDGCDISNPNVSTSPVTNLVQGTYSFRLIVWNSQWVPSDDTVNIVVNGSRGSQNSQQVANAGADITISFPTNQTVLDGSGSHDPQGPIQLYHWTKISGPGQYNIGNPVAASTALTNLEPGSYRFRLVVWNNQWVPSADTVNVTVNTSGNTNPSSAIASAGDDVFIWAPDHTTVLNGSNSRNPNGPILGYQWNKISGPSQHSFENPNSAITIVSGLTPGVYLFQLVVFDHQWIPSADIVQVTIGTPYNGATYNREATSEIIPEEKLTVYPNPAKDIINVRAANSIQGNAVINIYDINGRIVKKINFTKNQQILRQNINIVGLASGVYHLEIIVDNKKRSITKFIKR